MSADAIRSPGLYAVLRGEEVAVFSHGRELTDVEETVTSIHRGRI